MVQCQNIRAIECLRIFIKSSIAAVLTEVKYLISLITRLYIYNFISKYGFYNAIDNDWFPKAGWGDWHWVFVMV